MKPNILFNLMLEYIKTFPKVLPQYKYEHEESINPAYCDIDHCIPLCLNEKRIWVMRTDSTLALGIKNSNTFEGNTNLLHKIDETMHQYININDRYGHPSLALPENEYDGSAHYAGWLHQHSNRLEVLVGSGRYQNKELLPLQIIFLKSYIYLKLIEAYGEQKIIFTDWSKPEELEYFLQGISLPNKQPPRIYSATRAKIDCILIPLLCSSLNEHHDNTLNGLTKKMIIAFVSESIKHVFSLALRGMLEFLISIIIEKDLQPILVNHDNSDQRSSTTHRGTSRVSVATNLTNVSMFKAEVHPANDDCEVTHVLRNI